MSDLETTELLDDEGSDDVGSEAYSLFRGLFEWVVVLVGAVLVALVLRAFVFQAFWIPSESMETTLMIQDRILVNKVSYHLHEINRGDIVVFERPDDQVGEIRDLIKRVIGLPGDTVEGRDNEVYINGVRLIEDDYLPPEIVTTDFGPIVVPDGELFVMGDNRGQSFDSRFFGTVDESRVIGRAFVLFWPLDRIGTL